MLCLRENTPSSVEMPGFQTNNGCVKTHSGSEVGFDEGYSSRHPESLETLSQAI